MEKTSNTASKWYDKNWLVIVLCVFIFPVGLYALWKSSVIPKHWKIPMTAIILVYGFMLINIKDIESPTDAVAPVVTTENNKSSQPIADNPQKNNFVTAPLADEAKQHEEDDLKRLKAFQKRWADSIVKTENTPENDFHLISSKLALPDTILFEYSANMTKYGFEANFQQDVNMYNELYTTAVKSKFGDKYLSYPVYISFIPNQNVVSKIDKSIEYEHPSLAFYGIRVYKGNEFSKELIGRVSCLYKDPSKGFGDMYAEMVIIYGKKGRIEIPHYLFRKNYWTTKEENDISKPVIECN